MNEVIIRELTYKYDKKIIFDNISFNIEENTFTNIIINNGEGKTTLIKILSGLLQYKGYININKTVLDKNSVNRLRNIVSYVFGENINLFYVSAREEIENKLLNLRYSKKEVKKNIEEIISIFNLNEYIDLPSYIIPKSKKALIKIAYYLSNYPKVLILDDAFMYMDELDKNIAIKGIKKIMKKYKLTVINISSEIEKYMEKDNIIIVEDSKIKYNDKYENLYVNCNYLSNKLPFMIEICDKLKYYNLTENYIESEKELIDNLWK